MMEAIIGAVLIVAVLWGTQLLKRSQQEDWRRIPLWKLVVGAAVIVYLYRYLQDQGGNENELG